MNNRCEPVPHAHAETRPGAEREVASPDRRIAEDDAGAGAWYAAVVLAIAGALSQIDRQIMGLLMEPVKQDLALSDVQVSLLYGLAVGSPGTELEFAL